MCLRQLLDAASVGALGGREQVRLAPLGSGSMALFIIFFPFCFPYFSSPAPFILLLLKFIFIHGFLFETGNIIANFFSCLSLPSLSLSLCESMA
jgi:hypothetical protein